ncbi:hypothetical protein C8P63_10280 [Melghirimyces profundicolus]|uniref:Uncharacterized protein n=1 Tax=Melghirimyces profundicolus TaxID=1242148 RepID=A0A2T6C8I4_9BACL|nr:hypothetical protein [Melghirimyces profundicolus]PTX64586.1 hypothetical protein C8P63_10280 [Melghirimyces profundicolus]
MEHGNTPSPKKVSRLVGLFSGGKEPSVSLRNCQLPLIHEKQLMVAGSLSFIMWIHWLSFENVDLDRNSIPHSNN